jgi:opacity protein-like surface antigen
MKKTLLIAAMLITLATASAQTNVNIGVGTSTHNQQFRMIEVSGMFDFIYLQGVFSPIKGNHFVINFGIQMPVDENFSITAFVGEMFNSPEQSTYNIGLLFNYKIRKNFSIYAGASKREAYKIGLNYCFDLK